MPAARDHGLAAHGVRAERQRNALERLAFKAIAEDIGPGDGEAAIGGPQRRDRHAFRARAFHPCAVGAEPRPAGAAEREHGRVRFDAASPRPAFRTQDVRRSSQPVQRWRSANCTPIASSRRSHARSKGEALNACGKTRPLEPTKVGCPSASLHSRNASRRKRRDRGFEMRHRAAVARQELRQRLAVRQVEPAAPGHQELAAGRRHRVIDRDAGAALGQHFGRHQPGRTGADDGDLGLN